MSKCVIESQVKDGGSLDSVTMKRWRGTGRLKKYTGHGTTGLCEEGSERNQ